VTVRLDPITDRHLRESIDDLSVEFAGVFSHETIERYVREALDHFADARIATYIPLLAYRYSRERLQALAQVHGLVTKTAPEVLFVCVHNAGRSQMAAGLLHLRSEGRIHVRSAGSAPGEEINPAAIEAMQEIGVDLSQEFPKPLSDEVVRAADVVITMGCGDACPIYPGKRYEDWVVDDPEGKSLDDVRRIRDVIDERVQQLVTELTPSYS
jgi:protein-tyrosine-phosphatase